MGGDRHRLSQSPLAIFLPAEDARAEQYGHLRSRNGCILSEAEPDEVKMESDLSNFLCVSVQFLARIIFKVRTSH